jgi:hypothetical protein
MVAYPISKGASINVVGFVQDETREETHHEGSWFENVSKAEALSAFQGFEQEAQALFEVCQCFMLKGGTNNVNLRSAFRVPRSGQSTT